MARKSTGNVRIGIVSFITLLAILLMSVLAVLCVVTARATWATTQKQATSVDETYQIDAVGQAVLSQIDAQAATYKTQGGSAAQVIASVGANAAKIQTVALESVSTGESNDGAAATGDAATSMELSLSTSGNSVNFSVSAANGRKLEARVSITDSLSYKIDEWKMSTAQTQQEENLWSGAGANASATSSH